MKQKTITIPIPLVAHLGWEVDDPNIIQEVWDTFIKPSQDAGEVQSGEMRVLMAILRSVYQGLLDAQEVDSN